MKKISNLILAIESLIINKANLIDDLDILSITNDSRKAISGSVFFAIKGTSNDGHNFIDQVVSGGASIVIGDRPLEDVIKTTENTFIYIQVSDALKAWALASQFWFDYPTENMSIVGITGTNGKTTTAHIIFEIWKKLGKKAGMLSTIENRIMDEVFETTHTTPDAYILAETFSKMKEAGVTNCVMEVSSHSLIQNRVFGIHFDGTIFTNLTQDHLDFHLTMEEYAHAKKILFSNLYLNENSYSIINIDDKWGEYMAKDTPGNVVRFSLGNSHFNTS